MLDPTQPGRGTQEATELTILEIVEASEGGYQVKLSGSLESSVITTKMTRSALQLGPEVDSGAELSAPVVVAEVGVNTFL